MPVPGYKSLTVPEAVIEIANRLGKTLKQPAPQVVLRALQEIEEMWQTAPDQRTVPKMVQVLDVEASKQSTPLPPGPVVYPPVPPRGAVLNERPKDPRKTPSTVEPLGDATPVRERAKLMRKGTDGTKQG